MNIYVAASYPRKEEALKLCSMLLEHGHVIVSGWVFEDEGYGSDDRVETQEQMYQRLQVAAIRDFRDVKACDLFISLIGDTLSCGGRHTELGIALALGKKIVIIGDYEQVFHYHFLMHRYNDVGNFLYAFLENYGT